MSSALTTAMSHAKTLEAVASMASQEMDNDTANAAKMSLKKSKETGDFMVQNSV